jgi:hypothetical protein
MMPIGRPRNEYWLMNPKADIACGAVDPSAKIPEHVHYGCKECRNIVRELLLSRVLQKPVAVEQLAMFELHPVKRKKAKRAR